MQLKIIIAITLVLINTKTKIYFLHPVYLSYFRKKEKLYLYLVFKIQNRLNCYFISYILTFHLIKKKIKYKTLVLIVSSMYNFVPCENLIAHLAVQFSKIKKLWSRLSISNHNCGQRNLNKIV